MQAAAEGFARANYSLSVLYLRSNVCAIYELSVTKRICILWWKLDLVSGQCDFLGIDPEIESQLGIKEVSMR